MSTFFVHDLKNTASTLSLMLQNLPVHFADPKFREDALRGISKTITHINDLIGRLGLLRQELTVRAVECDLNELVKAVVSSQESGLRTQETEVQSPKSKAQTLGHQSINPSIHQSIRTELHPVPRVRVDEAQIQNVLTNLVLNAREAIAADG